MDWKKLFKPNKKSITITLIIYLISIIIGFYWDYQRYLKMCESVGYPGCGPYTIRLESIDDILSYFFVVLIPGYVFSSALVYNYKDTLIWTLILGISFSILLIFLFYF